MMKKTIGILAHVDAGKTTFSEQVLYRTGAIRSAGRVDHHNAFLDLHPVERERGITVFSDQAMFDIGENRYYWLDTPGHSDFISEMERTLPVLDYAILIVSCTEGVESHTETIWHLLEEHHVPALIFVNKLDRPDANFERCLSSMKALLAGDIVDMRGFDGVHMDTVAIEAIAERDEELLERLLAEDYDFEAWRQGFVHALQERRIFPVFAGAALSGDGIDTFLKAMDAITDTAYAGCLSQSFAAQIYKIRHDAQGAQQVYLKITHGCLKVKDEIETAAGRCKINDLKLCHGAKNTAVPEAYAGDLVCTSGLNGLQTGDGLGAAAGRHDTQRTEPMLEVRVIADPTLPQTKLLQALRILEEEDPALHITHHARTGEISLRMMGRIQTEIIARLMQERFGIAISFGPARILYMETIAQSAVGIGHYEPLKHYAEVWLRLSPAPRGSGIQFESKCHVDALALNWQRLIETHVFERTHPGVLIGAPLTDVRIELIAGRAHLKHTEGGDFRESTYRAIRNGLMHAQNVLLEPICRFRLRMPSDSYGRITGDLNRMQAELNPPVPMGDWILMEGCCPFRLFADYPETFRAVTHGRGSLSMHLSHYAPAANAEEVIAEANYDPLAEDSPNSVFCSHGAGHIVLWNEVRAHAHCEVDPDGV